MIIQKIKEIAHDVLSDVEMDTRGRKVSTVLIALLVIFPALIMGGFLKDLSFPKSILTLVAMSGGILSGILWLRDKKHWMAGLAGGGVAGAAILWFTYFYIMGRTNVFEIELLIPMFAGALLGYCVYKIVKNIM